jgi:hypothetical protein
MRIRIRRLLRYWPHVSVVATVLLIYAAWPGRWTFTVSPGTTYVTEPVDANGFVDYPTALNERIANGITPEKNSNVLLWQALGPHPEGGTMPPDYFRWLGAPSPPENGEYLLRWDKYIQANLKDPPADVLGLFDNPDAWRQFWANHLDRLKAWPWRRDAELEVTDWLKRNEKPLILAVEASRRAEYFNPLVSRSADPASARLIGSLLPNVQDCRTIALALACRAMARTTEGDFDGAWQDLMACQRLGRLIGRSATLIETLVGIALSTIATNAQVTLLGLGPHPPERLRSWLADIRALPPFPPMADKLDLAERFVCLDSMTSVVASLDKGLAGRSAIGSGVSREPHFTDRLFTRSIDFDPAFRKINETYDRMVSAARLPDRASRKREFAKIGDDFEQGSREFSKQSVFGQLAATNGERGARIGHILLGLMLPALDKLQDAMDRAEQTHCNLQVAFALAAYRADAGRYPAGLTELAPKYLPAVPGDLFSGGPLIYRPTQAGYLLYSVGPNGKDDEGRGADDDPKGDDLRVRMPVEEPRAKEERPGK